MGESRLQHLWSDSESLRMVQLLPWGVPEEEREAYWLWQAWIQSVLANIRKEAGGWVLFIQRGDGYTKASHLKLFPSLFLLYLMFPYAVLNNLTTFPSFIKEMLKFKSMSVHTFTSISNNVQIKAVLKSNLTMTLHVLSRWFLRNWDEKLSPSPDMWKQWPAMSSRLYFQDTGLLLSPFSK